MFKVRKDNNFWAVYIRIFCRQFCIPSALSKKYFFFPEEAHARDEVESKKKKEKDSTTTKQTSNICLLESTNKIPRVTERVSNALIARTFT